MCGPDSPPCADPPHTPLLFDPILAHLIAKVAINQATSHPQQVLGSLVLLPLESIGWCPHYMAPQFALVGFPLPPSQLTTYSHRQEGCPATQIFLAQG